MPSSSWKGITDIIDITMSLDPMPKSFLDVGVGNGKYGFLLKEYLHYWGRRYDREWQARDGYSIVGIEAFPKYVEDVHRLIYDEILIGNASDILPTLKDSQFDLLFLIDVLEHFDTEEGGKALAECKRVGKLVVVSTAIRNMRFQGICNRISRSLLP